MADERRLPTGYIGRMIIRLILLFLVLSQVTFLASRYRARVDLTSDELYTLTSSTQTVLEKLDDRLLIEAYFTPKQTLPILDQPKRDALVNILEEYEKLSGGKVTIKFIDPLEDKTAREKAERLGMNPQTAEDRTGRGVTRVDIWQGLRFRYGGRKQEVIPYVPFPTQGRHPTAFYERVLTPLIKRLTVTKRTKIGVLAFQSRPGGQGGGLSLNMEAKTPPRGFSQMQRVLGYQYEPVPLDLSKGQLIPEEIGIAMLVRPKYLSERTMFVFDQFLMRGGQLVIFADTCELEIRQDRAFRGTVVPYEAPNSKLRFTDMLKTYGVEVRNQIVGDGVHNFQQLLYDLRQNRQTGQPQPNLILYPYMFEAANDDWTKLAEAMATDSSGKVDPVLAKQYKEQVQPGMNQEHDLIKGILAMGAPGMFWPCPVELMKVLPADVDGRVLLRSSPLSWVEPPNTPLDPFGEAPQFQEREQNLRRWTISKQNMRPSLPQQYSLMVHLEGEFPSFFAEKEIPVPAHLAAKKDEAKPKKDVEDWGSDPDKKESKKDDEPLPKPAEDAAAARAKETKLTKARKVASLVVIGDATFIRDDFIAGVYQQPDSSHGLPLYGPLDRQGGRAQLFLRNLLNWMAQERDLQALENKRPTNRAMEFVVRNEAQQETNDEFYQRAVSRTKFFRWVNSVGPMLLLLAFGLGIWLTRRAKKRAFLANL